MSFKIGDLVYVHRNATTQTVVLKDKIGCVKHIKPKEYGGGEYIGVEFSEDIGGHSLDGHCEESFGYWMNARDIVRMEPLSTLLQKQWMKEWEPKLRIGKDRADSVIILEE
jgi:hypothetical protein